MKIKQKLVLMVFVVAVFFCPGLYAAGGGQSGAAGGSGNYLLVDRPVTLTVFTNFDAKASATIKSYNEMACFVGAAERTGITLDFIHPAAGQETERFNLMVASGEYTDIIKRPWTSYPGGPDKAIGDGVIIDIKQLVEQHGPNYLKILQTDPRANIRDVMTDSGKMSFFTFFRLENWIRYTDGLYFREDWLKKLNLKTPETIAEWHSVLTALKNGNPNGTGDTIPYVGTGAGALHRFIPAYGVKRDFYFDQGNGAVKFGSIEPGYRDHILEMQRWVREGLVDPDLLSTNTTTFNAKITGHKGASFGGLLAGNMSTFMGLMQGDASFQLVGAKWPRLDSNGKHYNPSGTIRQAASGTGYAISTSCKMPAEAVKILDWFYSPEGHNMINFGPPGQAYDMVNGKPVLKDFIMNNRDLSPVSAISRYGLVGIDWSYTQDPDGFAQILRYNGVREAADVFADSSMDLNLPLNITPNYEEGARLANIMSEVWNFVDESYAEWVFRGRSLSNWDSYVTQIRRMGIDEAIRIQEAALARYNRR